MSGKVSGTGRRMAMWDTALMFSAYGQSRSAASGFLLKAGSAVAAAVLPVWVKPHFTRAEHGGNIHRCQWLILPLRLSFSKQRQRSPELSSVLRTHLHPFQTFFCHRAIEGSHTAVSKTRV